MFARIAPLLAIAALNALIGLFVLRRNPTRVPNRAFAFLAFSITAWTLGITLTHNIPVASTLFTRATFAAASLLIFALLLLFWTFPDQQSLRWHWTLSVLAVTAVSLAALSFSPLIVAAASLERHGLEVRYGSLHPLFALYIYTCFAASVILLASKYRASTGLVRLQFNYLLLGLLVPGLGVTVTNLLIPLILGSSRAGQYGPYFAVPFLAFTAHALIHYRFMDIRLVLRRGATFALAMVGAISALSLGFGLAWAFGLFRLDQSHIAIFLISSVVLSALLPVLQHTFGRLLDRYVSRRSPNYPRTLHETSQALASILDLADLTNHATQTIQAVLRAEKTCLYLTRGDYLELQHEKRGRSAVSPAPSLLPFESEVVRSLMNSREALVTEELSQRLNIDRGRLLLQELHRENLGLVVPIHSQKGLEGALALGPKLSGDPFFPDELEFLQILANQVGTAVRNAELYTDVVLANEFIQNILATIDSGVIAADEHRRVMLFNKAAEDMTGMSADTLRDQPVDKLSRSLAAEIDATLINGLPRLQIESLILDSLGRVTPIICSTTPLRDRTGAVRGAVSVFSDLSRVKELESEKRRAERLAAFGAFASGIAHEIKNPLVAIRTFAELIPDRFSDEEFRRDFSGVVLKEIARIDNLVGRLRGLVVPSHSSFRPTDILEPLEETLMLLRGQLLQRRATVHRQYQALNTRIQGDPDQLKQLFLNILVNALEAMEEGGSIEISVSDLATREGPRVATTFSDSGAGIPDGLAGKIFDPFVTSKPHGSGLGLAICRGIADAHKATIRAVNRSDRMGTSVVLEFPVTNEAWSNAPLKE